MKVNGDTENGKINKRMNVKINWEVLSCTQFARGIIIYASVLISPFVGCLN